jgi:hypothetical protein
MTPVPLSILCKDKGIYRCSCPRLYTNPSATWGWDSYHERWFYGHSLYALTAAGGLHDLPLLLHITQASYHDSGTIVAAYAQMRALYPELNFSAALLDLLMMLMTFISFLKLMRLSLLFV